MPSLRKKIIIGLIIGLLIITVSFVVYLYDNNKYNGDGNGNSNNGLKMIHKKEIFANQTISPAIYNTTNTINNMDVWIVPNGVTEATFTVIGGRGGNNLEKHGSRKGGNGANVTCKLNVIPNTTYNIAIGSNAGDELSINNSQSRTGERGICGNGNIGFNGSVINQMSWSNASGGAASVVYIGNPPNITPIIVAGGGGGAGAGTNGGNAGNTDGSGGNGISSNCIGGIGGLYTNTYNLSNTNGKPITQNVCGGGGGGMNGGNMGTGNNCGGGSTGGGAGSSYITTSAVGTYSVDNTGIPSVTISWVNPTTTAPPTTTSPEVIYVSYPIIYVSGVNSIVILSNTTDRPLSLSCVFIYDNNGNLIDLINSNGYFASIQEDPEQNPFQSSTDSNATPEKALNSITIAKSISRTLNKAISPLNTPNNSNNSNKPTNPNNPNNPNINSFLGIPETVFSSTNNSNFVSNTGSTPDQKSYWIYNFSSPVNISAVEIFTTSDFPERTSQISIKLFSSKIEKIPNIIDDNTKRSFLNNLESSINLLSTANFREVSTSNPSADYFHGVFVIDKQYAARGINYIYKFNTPIIPQQEVERKVDQSMRVTPKKQSPITTFSQTEPQITQGSQIIQEQQIIEKPQITIALALSPTQEPVITKFNCNSIQDQYDCNNVDDCYYIKNKSQCKNKSDYSKDFSSNSSDFSCQIYQDYPYDTNSNYNLKCINTTKNPNQNEASFKYLFDNISVDPNCDAYDNQCNLLLNNNSNIVISNNELKDYMIQFNSFNNEFNTNQKFTSNKIISPDNKLYFHDIHGNYANINVRNNSATQNGIVYSNTGIIDESKRNLQMTDFNISSS
jgi:hypothetical protein